MIELFATTALMSAMALPAFAAKPAGGEMLAEDEIRKAIATILA